MLVAVVVDDGEGGEIDAEGRGGRGGDGNADIYVLGERRRIGDGVAAGGSVDAEEQVVLGGAEDEGSAGGEDDGRGSGCTLVELPGGDGGGDQVVFFVREDGGGRGGVEMAERPVAPLADRVARVVAVADAEVVVGVVLEDGASGVGADEGAVAEVDVDFERADRDAVGVPDKGIGAARAGADLVDFPVAAQVVGVDGAEEGGRDHVEVGGVDDLPFEGGLDDGWGGGAAVIAGGGGLNLEGDGAGGGAVLARR